MEIAMKTAFEALQEDRNRLKLTTGSGDLDSLIDGVMQGQLYLFYSNDQNLLDLLVHRVLINCVLPVEEGGFNSKALYFNVCNYHRGKTILDPSRLAMISKHAGLDPKLAFQNIYSVSAFNEMQQVTATKEVVDLLAHDRDIKLIVIHNLTRFIETSRKPLEARQALKKIVGMMRSAACEHNVALIFSCGANNSSRRRIPKPVGGTFLRQEVGVIVYLNEVKKGPLSKVKATLVKHPYKETPQSITLYKPREGVDLMGRITPSFRQQFKLLIEELRRSNGFQNTLLSLEHKKALDMLLKEAWSAEDAAMSNSGIPCVLDILNLMANVHNKKCVEELRKKVLELEIFLKEQNEKKEPVVEGN
jgi:hypothetical protein